MSTKQTEGNKAQPKPPVPIRRTTPKSTTIRLDSSTRTVQLPAPFTVVEPNETAKTVEVVDVTPPPEPPKLVEVVDVTPPPEPPRVIDVTTHEPAKVVDVTPPKTVLGNGSPRAKNRAFSLLDVTPEAVEWLWERRIPMGKLSLLDGDPAVGKTTALCAIAAAVTTGRPLPMNESREPGGVLFVVVEDGVNDTIYPRLQAAGADISKIFVFDPAHPISLPDDVGLLEEEVRRTQSKLLVIDPIIATMGKAATNDQSVRATLQPLLDMAGRTGVAVLAVRHMTKSGKSNVIYRGSGSIAIMGLARSALLIARCPDDPSKRVLVTTKHNLAAAAPALRFGFEDTANGRARITWLGESIHDGDEVLAVSGDPEKRLAFTEAIDFLRDILKAGSLPVAEVKTAASAAGHSWMTIRRAQARLGIKPHKGTGEAHGTWAWALPDNATSKPAE